MHDIELLSLLFLCSYSYTSNYPNEFRYCLFMLTSFPTKSQRQMCDDAARQSFDDERVFNKCAQFVRVRKNCVGFQTKQCEMHYRSAFVGQEAVVLDTRKGSQRAMQAVWRLCQRHTSLCARPAGPHPGDTVVPRRLTARTRSRSNLQMRGPSIGDPRPAGVSLATGARRRRHGCQSSCLSAADQCPINATLSDYFHYERHLRVRLRLNCDLSRTLRRIRAPFRHLSCRSLSLLNITVKKRETNNNIPNRQSQCKRRIC